MEIKKMLMAVFVIAIIALTGCINTQPQEDNVITVQGSSELTFKPDKAEVSAGFTIVKKTAEEAQNEANTIINAIIDGLRYKGIQESDIQTDQLSLYEEKTWENNNYVSQGWRATQTLTIKTIDLTKVGTIVDICTKNGANQINGINFGLTDAKEQQYKQQALAEATKNAKSKAETMASNLGVQLGDIKSVSESNYNYRPYMYAMSSKSVGAADMVQEAANVLPSDVSITADINIVYKIK